MANARGFTLVEMLVAMAVTLIILAALANIFSWLGTSVNDTRATIDMASRLRHTRNQLQLDLAGITSPMLPPLRPEAGLGYFEYLEDIRNDDTTLDGLDGTGAQDLSELDEGGPTDIGRYLSSPNAPANVFAPSNQGSLVGYSTLGDYDDLLMFTSRSRGDPFVGRLGSSEQVESQVAEIIWFAVENPADGSLGQPGMRTIYRKVLLVAPSAAAQIDLIDPNARDLSGFTNNSQKWLALGNFQQAYDVSARVDLASNQIVLNTLADLTKRENRFGHAPPWAFPHPPMIGTIRFDPAVTAPQPTQPLRPFDVASGRLGEDVMLRDVVAFDVRAFDPGAPLFNYLGSVISPGDPAYRTEDLSTLSPVGYGAYVDLNYFLPNYTPSGASVTLPVFSGSQNVAHFNTRATIPANSAGAVEYDTWSYHYEHDGIDQDNRDGDGNYNTGADEGTDGFDSDGANGVDDAGERETSPPYPVPLRGIQVRIRVYEPDSRAIREVSVLQDFVPE